MTRRFDGKAETDADRRFFDLRASGYTGPIDEHGHKVTDAKTLDTFTALDATTASGNRR